MKDAIYTNAAEVLAAGVARLRPDSGICASPWHLTGMQAGNANARTYVVPTESKLHFRWPGDPSS